METNDKIILLFATFIAFILLIVAIKIADVPNDKYEEEVDVLSLYCDSIKHLPQDEQERELKVNNLECN